jgi:hypothetical protein
MDDPVELKVTMPQDVADIVARLKLGHERRSVWFLGDLSGPSRGIDTPPHARLVGEPDQGRSADRRAARGAGT